MVRWRPSATTTSGSIQTRVDGPTFWYALSYYSDVLPLISGCWLLLFLFFGFYQSSPSSSRFDEIFEVVKVVTLGILLAMVATFDRDIRLTRLLVLFYWLGHGRAGGGWAGAGAQF